MSKQSPRRLPTSARGSAKSPFQGSRSPKPRAFPDVSDEFQTVLEKTDWYVHEEPSDQINATFGFDKHVQKNANTAYVWQLLKLFSTTQHTLFNGKFHKLFENDCQPPLFGEDDFHEAKQRAERDWNQFKEDMTVAKQMMETHKSDEFRFGTLHKYCIGNTIGEGSTSAIYIAHHTETNQTRAAKFTPKTKISRSDLFQRALSISKSLNHEHIIKTHDIFENESYVITIIDYCDYGTLFNYMQLKLPHLHEDVARMVMTHLIEGVQYLHENMGIAHRDIKPENVLLSLKSETELHARLGDFGVATESEVGKFHEEWVGTIHYMSPEMVAKKPYEAFPCDVWSLGVTLFAMLVGRMPFQGSDVGEVAISIGKSEFMIPATVSDHASSLLKNMLKREPITDRFTINQVRKSAWVFGEGQKILPMGNGLYYRNSAPVSHDSKSLVTVTVPKSPSPQKEKSVIVKIVTTDAKSPTLQREPSPPKQTRNYPPVAYPNPPKQTIAKEFTGIEGTDDFIELSKERSEASQAVKRYVSKPSVQSSEETIPVPSVLPPHIKLEPSPAAPTSQIAPVTKVVHVPKSDAVIPQTVVLEQSPSANEVIIRKISSPSGAQVEKVTLEQSPSASEGSVPKLIPAANVQLEQAPSSKNTSRPSSAMKSPKAKPEPIVLEVSQSGNEILVRKDITPKSSPQEPLQESPSRRVIVQQPSSSSKMQQSPSAQNGEVVSHLTTIVKSPKSDKVVLLESPSRQNVMIAPSTAQKIYHSTAQSIVLTKSPVQESRNVIVPELEVAPVSAFSNTAVIRKKSSAPSSPKQTAVTLESSPLSTSENIIRRISAPKSTMPSVKLITSTVQRSVSASPVRPSSPKPQLVQSVGIMQSPQRQLITRAPSPPKQVIHIEQSDTSRRSVRSGIYGTDDRVEVRRGRVSVKTERSPYAPIMQPSIKIHSPPQVLLGAPMPIATPVAMRPQTAPMHTLFQPVVSTPVAMRPAGMSPAPARPIGMTPFITSPVRQAQTAPRQMRQNYQFQLPPTRIPAQQQPSSSGQRRVVGSSTGVDSMPFRPQGPPQAKFGNVMSGTPLAAGYKYAGPIPKFNYTIPARKP